MSSDNANWNMFDSDKLVKYAKEMGEVDASLESYLLQVEKGKASLKDYNNYITGTSQKLNGLKTALVSAGKSIVLNLAIGTVVSAATAGITWLVSTIQQKFFPTLEQLEERTEEAKSKYENADSEISSLNDELDENKIKIDELQNKGSLTYVEKSQLNDLKDATQELERQLEIQKSLKADSSRELAKDTIDEYKKKYDDSTAESVSSKIELVKKDTTGQYGYSFSNTKSVESNAKDYIVALKQIQEFEEKYKNTEDEYWKTEYNSLIEQWRDRLQDTESNFDTISADLSEKMADMEEGYNLALDNKDKNQLSSSDKETIQYYERMRDLLSEIQKLRNPGKYNSDQISSVFDNKKLKYTKEQLIDLYKSGELDATIENDKGLKDYINNLNLQFEDGTTNLEAFKNEIAGYISEEEEAIEVTKKDVLSKSGMIDKINGMSDAFTVLDDIYADVKDGDTFDFSKLDSKKFGENFKDLDAEYTAFIETVSASPNDLSKCQAAFDKLTEAYINQQGILNELTDENASVAESMLTNMGISNAHEVVQEKLQAQNELVANSLNDIDLSNQDVSDSANETIEQMITEGKVSGTLATQMYNLYIQENILNNNKLDMSQKIQELTKLAVSYGIAADSASNLNTIENDIRLAKHYGGSDQDVYNAYSDKYSKAIEEKFGNIDFKYTGAMDSNKTKSSSSQKDKWLEEYKKKLSILQDQLDKELIDERTFYNESEKLLNQYLKDTPEHISKYEEEISDAEKTLHSNWINAYQAQHDKLENSLNDGTITAIEYCQQLAKLGQEYYGIFDNIGLKSVDELPESLQNSVKAFQDAISSTNDTSFVDEQYDQLAAEARACGYNIEEYIGQKGSKAVQKYGQYVKEATEVIKELKEQIKSTFDNAINGVITVLDKQISSVQDNCDKITKSYENQQKALEKQIKVHEKEIKAIEKQKDVLEEQKDLLEEKKDAIQQQIDDIEEEANARQRELDLEEALYELNRLSNQKTKQTIDGNGNVTYDVDSKGISSARENVQKANQEIEKAKMEQQIKDIQSQIDLIDKQIDALDKQIDKINDIIDELNDQKDAFSDLIDATEEYYDGIVKGLQDYQKQWQSLIDESEKQEALKLAKELGITEGEILGLSQEAFDKVKDKYNQLLDVIYNGGGDIEKQFAILNSLGTEEFQEALKNAGIAVSDFKDQSAKDLEETVATTASILGVDSESSDGESSSTQSGNGNEDTSTMVGVVTTSENLIQTGFDAFSLTMQSAMENLINEAIRMSQEIVKACEEAKRAFDEMSKYTSANISIPHHAAGTGASFADGTGRLESSEKNALVGEIAPELVVDTEHGTTQLFDKPTMVDLPKGAIVYNGVQTERILSDKQSLAGGKSFAAGTNPNPVIDNLLKQSEKLRNVIAEQTFNPLLDSMKHRFNEMATSFMNNISTTNNNDNSTNISSNIGDIYVQGVQNPEGLANAIKKKMPTIMIQKMNRSK